jgi:hypothetical protein
MVLNAAAQIVDDEIPTITMTASKPHERIRDWCIPICEDLGIAVV